MTSDEQDLLIDSIVGANIRALRSAAGVSQHRLGEGIGVSFQQVQKYETAANRVSGSKLFRIATALEVRIEDLFAGVTPPDDPAPEEAPDLATVALARQLIMTSGGGALARAFLRIEQPRIRRALIEMAVAIEAAEEQNAPSSID